MGPKVRADSSGANVETWNLIGGEISLSGGSAGLSLVSVSLRTRRFKEEGDLMSTSSSVDKTTTDASSRVRARLDCRIDCARSSY